LVEKNLFDIPLIADKLAQPLVNVNIHDAKPAELIRTAKALSIEGIVAKRKDCHYESGKRSGAWLKYKINKSQDFVIGGYTPLRYSSRQRKRVFKFRIQIRYSACQKRSSR
jgi:ATP-dependent DNA ligase